MDFGMCIGWDGFKREKRLTGAYFGVFISFMIICRH
jgi:hypothetical protein